MEFMVPYKKIWNNIFPIIPLFKMNPYLTIPNSIKSNDKYFYILIYNYYIDDFDLSIKKPKLFNNVQLNKINILPQLKGENAKYYYKIPLPKGDYNSLLVQSITSTSDIKMSLSKNFNIYPLFDEYNNNYNNIPIDKNDIENKYTYINYYDVNSTDGYITFIPVNEMKFIKPYDTFKFNMTVEQKNDANILKIKVNSYSYFNEQRPSIYFLIINKYQNNDFELNSMITGNTNFDEKNHQIMLKVEDNGLEEKIEYEVKIDIELLERGNYNDNNITIVPVDKESYISDFYYVETKYFAFINYNEKLYIIIIIIVVVLILIIGIAIFVYLYKKKKRKDPIIENDLKGNIID